MRLRLLLALALVAGAVRPPDALAHAGDVVLTRPAPGQPAVGAFATGTDPVTGRARTSPSGGGAGLSAGLAVPPPRRVVPHYLTAPGFDPARSISSARKRAQGKVDVFTRAKQVAESRESLGPAAFRRDVIRSEPGQDRVRIALIRIDFRTDREGSLSSGDGRFELQARDTLNRPLDPTPHDRAFFESHGEALRRYWEAQSAGRTVVETVVYPSAPESAFHLSDMADYGPWKFSPEIYQAAVKLFQDCLIAADTTESIPWSDFDRVIIVHAGSDLQSDVNQDSPLDIPTFTIGVADSDVVVVGNPADPDTIWSAFIGPETIRQDGYEGVVNAVYAHEAGHLIYGYRDVYDVVSGLPTVGYWSLMDVGNLLGNALTFPNGLAVYATGLLPPSVDPWQKRLIYPDVPVARFPSYGAEEALANSSEGYEVMQVPLSGEEYLLLENRLDDLNGNGQLTLTRDRATGVILGPALEDTLEYDFLVPGPGILAWHVDESVADYFGPRADPGYGLNVNRSRFGLQILEADGLDDLGDFDSPFALGVPSDTWKEGPHSRLNWNTIPRLRTNSRTNPHLDLEFTSPPGSVMSLRVTREWDLPGWPVTVVQPPAGIAPIVANVGPMVGSEPAWSLVAWAGGDSAVHARSLGGDLPPGGSGAGDVVFKAPGPLGPVVSVPHGGGLLATARTDSGATEGTVYVIGIIPGDVEVSTYTFPAAVTAGPTCASDAPDRLLVGLANGRVCEIRTDTQSVRDLGGASSGRVTGLALDGNLFAAADGNGRVLRGRFGGAQADAAVQVAIGLETLPAGRRLQPLLLRTASPAASAEPFESRLMVVDRTLGSVREVECTALNPTRIEPWQGRELGDAVGPPSIDDLDGDGLPEIGFLSAGGRVGYWNLNGSTSPGWPPELEREGFISGAGPVSMRVPQVTPDAIQLALLGNGVMLALDGSARNVPGFPLGFSVGARGTPALANTGCSTYLYAAGGDTLLYGIAVFGDANAACPPLAEYPRAMWINEGGDPGRSYASRVVFAPAIAGAGSPILEGTVRAYPNPARQQPITFAFRLREAARVTISVYDAAARLVERIERDGSTSDNAITWDPAGRVSGLYVARIEVPGQVITTPFALIR